MQPKKGGKLVFYTDIHSHMLCGCDDGAADEATMYAMLDEAYASGTRVLCLTPHFQPVFYGDNVDSSKQSFDRLSAYAKEKYPDMQLHLGNELGYYTSCSEALAAGRCRLLGGRYLLMDFVPNVPLFTLRYAMDEVLSAGYHVILAHVERYRVLRTEADLLFDWAQRGTLFQVNASTFSDMLSFRQKRFVKFLMQQALVHAVASDSHDLHGRSPSLAKAERVITDRFGSEMAELLLCHLPNRILAGQPI